MAGKWHSSTRVITTAGGLTALARLLNAKRTVFLRPNEFTEPSQQREIVPDAQLGQQCVDRRHLNAPARTDR